MKHPHSHRSPEPTRLERAEERHGRPRSARTEERRGGPRMRPALRVLALLIPGIAILLAATPADGSQGTAATAEAGVNRDAAARFLPAGSVREQIRSRQTAATGPTLAIPDTLYRAARAALNRGEFAEAARLFQTFRETSPDSPHLQEAYFWEALARYQETAEVQRALQRDEIRRLLESGEEPRAILQRNDSVAAVLEQQIARLQEASRLLEVQAAAGEAARGVSSTRAEAERLEAAIQQAQARLTYSRAAAQSDTLPRPHAYVLPQGQRGDWAWLQSAPAEWRVQGTGTARPVAFSGTWYGLAGTPPGCDAGELRNRQAALHSVLSRTPEALEEVLAELRVDPEQDPCAVALRRAALQAVAAAGADAPTILLALARDDPDEQVRRIALLELARSSDASSRELAWELLRESAVPESMEGGVVRELARSPAPDDADRLQALFPRLRSDEARAAVLAALLAADRETDRQWVRAMIADFDVPLELRAAALNQAGWLATDMDFLYSLFRDTDESVLRRQVIWAVAGSNDPGATSFLIMAYRETEEPELRRAVVDVLGQRDDDLALRALRSILRGELPEER